MDEMTSTSSMPEYSIGRAWTKLDNDLNSFRISDFPGKGTHFTATNDSDGFSQLGQASGLEPSSIHPQFEQTK